MNATITEKPGQRPRVLTEVIAVRIEPALYDRIEAAAVAEGRTLSGWMRQMAIEKLEKRR